MGTIRVVGIPLNEYPNPETHFMLIDVSHDVFAVYLVNGKTGEQVLFALCDNPADAAIEATTRKYIRLPIKESENVLKWKTLPRRKDKAPFRFLEDYKESSDYFVIVQHDG